MQLKLHNTTSVEKKQDKTIPRCDKFYSLKIFSTGIPTKVDYI